MQWLTIGIAMAAALAGCAMAPASKTFPDAPEKVRGAVLKVLARCHDVKEEGNLIRTGNCPSPLVPGKPERLGRWRERHEVRLEGSTVEVRSVVEEGTGRRGTRWDRRPAWDAQEEVLEAVAQVLMENQ